MKVLFLWIEWINTCRAQFISEEFEIQDYTSCRHVYGRKVNWFDLIKGALMESETHF